MKKMERYFIEDYYTGLTILGEDGYYTKYFNTLKEAENFLNSLIGNYKELWDIEDNYYIVKEIDGKRKPIEY